MVPDLAGLFKERKCQLIMYKAFDKNLLRLGFLKTEISIFEPVFKFSKFQFLKYEKEKDLKHHHRRNNCQWNWLDRWFGIS